MKNFFKILVLLAAFGCLVTSDECLPLCDAQNIECMQDFFVTQSNGQCTPIIDPNENPVYYDLDPSSLSNSHLVVVTRESHLSGLRGKIEKFCEDSNGNLVMSVHYEELGFNFPVSQFVFGQRGKKSKVITEVSSGAYNVVLTAVHPPVPMTTESWKYSNISAYFPYPTADFSVGPKLTTSSDPVVLNALGGLATDLFTNMKQTFLAKASKNFFAYLQNYLCDFGFSPSIKNYYDPTVIESYMSSNDENEQCVSPCADADNLEQCVRDYFAEHATCTVVSDTNDEPVLREKYSTYSPLVNLTVDIFDAAFTGLHGKIETFCIYENSGVLLLTTVFDAVHIESQKSYAHIHKKGKAPHTVVGAVSATYPVAINIEIPISDGLTAAAVDSSLVSAFLINDDGDAVNFSVGENILTDSDPEVKKILGKMSEPSTKTKIANEFLYTESFSIARMYLQKYICNFNLPLTQRMYF